MTTEDQQLDVSLETIKATTRQMQRIAYRANVVLINHRAAYSLEYARAIAAHDNDTLEWLITWAQQGDAGSRIFLIAFGMWV